MNVEVRFGDPVVRDILEAALAEFANFGLAGARIEAIVARTQTSKRMIYYHFGSKEGLYVATLGYAYRKVGSDEVHPLIEAAPPLEALRIYAEAAFDRFCETPDFIRLTMQESLQGGKYLDGLADLQTINRQRLGVVEHILARGQRDGSMREGLRPLDVYANFVGLCVYHISARPNYRALFRVDWAEGEAREARKKAIADAIVRYVHSDGA
jgi:AcrR family transcriptional regulator